MMHTLLSQFSSACFDSGRTLNLKKTKVLSPATNNLPSIKINGKDIKKSVYLSSNVASNADLTKK